MSDLVPNWMLGQYAVSPFLIGVLVAAAAFGSVGLVLWVEIVRRRRRRRR